MQPDFNTLHHMAEAAEAAVQDRPAWMDFRTGVRRLLGTANWRHDEDRLAAAEAKRARKRARNTELQRSGSLR